MLKNLDFSTFIFHITGGALHIHDFAIIPIDFIVHNISYNDNLYMCFDDPNRKGSMRYGWFSRGEINSECSWISLNYARKELGVDVIDRLISDSLQFTAKDVSILNRTYVVDKDIDVVWRMFEMKIMPLADIVNYVPVFEACFYRGFQELFNDNIQYIEVYLQS